MNQLTQGKIAFYSAGILFIVEWIIMLCVYWFISEYPVILFSIPLLSAFIAYYLVFYLIERFIFRKINLFYKSLNVSQSKLSMTDIRDPELLDKVKRQVEQYQKDKTKEIAILKENERFRREFIGNVSHELKTPLTTIQGFVEILIDNIQNGRPIEEKYLQKIAKNSDRLIEIVNDLSLITKAESNKLKLDKTRFNIYELCLEVADTLEERARDKKIRINIDRNKSWNVFADNQKIYQVIFNLLENGISHCPEKSMIDIQCSEEDGKIHIEVADNGNGIDKDHLPRLFERFYRIENARSRDKGGSGLGLSIVKKILEAHGEPIHVESDIGRGTKFRFSLDKA